MSIVEKLRRADAAEKEAAAARGAAVRGEDIVYSPEVIAAADMLGCRPREIISVEQIGPDVVVRTTGSPSRIAILDTPDGAGHVGIVVYDPPRYQMARPTFVPRDQAPAKHAEPVAADVVPAEPLRHIIEATGNDSELGTRIKHLPATADDIDVASALIGCSRNDIHTIEPHADGYVVTLTDTSQIIVADAKRSGSTITYGWLKRAPFGRSLPLRNPPGVNYRKPVPAGKQPSWADPAKPWPVRRLGQLNDAPAVIDSREAVEIAKARVTELQAEATELADPNRRLFAEREGRIDEINRIDERRRLAPVELAAAAADVRAAQARKNEMSARRRHVVDLELAARWIRVAVELRGGLDPAAAVDPAWQVVVDRREFDGHRPLLAEHAVKARLQAGAAIRDETRGDAELTAIEAQITQALAELGIAPDIDAEVIDIERPKRRRGKKAVVS